MTSHLKGSFGQRRIRPPSAVGNVGGRADRRGCHRVRRRIRHVVGSGGNSFRISVFLHAGESMQRRAARAFYVGLAAGVAVYSPHLLFFWSIFGPAAVATLAGGGDADRSVCFDSASGEGIDLGETLGELALRRCFGPDLEYHRSECYYLKFAWLLPGQGRWASPRRSRPRNVSASTGSVSHVSAAAINRLPAQRRSGGSSGGGYGGDAGIL